LIALSTLYPEHKWDKRPCLSDPNTQRQFFDRLAVSLNIKKPEDWYNVTVRTAVKATGGLLTRYYNSSLIKGMTVISITNPLKHLTHYIHITT
jgi:hypothetical protein